MAAGKVVTHPEAVLAPGGNRFRDEIMTRTDFTVRFRKQAVRFYALVFEAA